MFMALRHDGISRRVADWQLAFMIADFAPYINANLIEIKNFV
jgi:hypothetical protein